LTDKLRDLRDWMFRGLMFESEADKFRNAGIRVGADIRDVEYSLLEEMLSPFQLELRNESLMMARIYTLLYCFENSIRELIRDRLQETFSADWWIKGVPQKVKEHAEGRQQKALDESWLEGQKSDPLLFVDFGHLAAIIIEQWEVFSDLVPSQHWLKQRMDELEEARHFIAHNRILLPSEFSRIEMYVSDWNKMVGL
jgi:hypothetical protein